MKTVVISSEDKTITVAEAFRLMLDQVKDGKTRITIGRDTRIASRGGLVYMDELKKQFLKFCKHQNVIPVNPLTPWDFDYTGDDFQNVRYVITVDQFRAFAQPFGFEISVNESFERKVINSATVDDVEASDPEWDADLSNIPLASSAARNKLVLSGYDKEPKRRRSSIKVAEKVTICGPIVPGPGISFAERDSSLDDEAAELDWGDDPLFSNASEGITSGDSGKSPQIGTNSRKGLRSVGSQFPKRRLPMREVDSDRRESIVEQPISAATKITDHDDELAKLFDPVRVAQLTKMFPDPKWSKWKKWAERAGRNGLHAAREGRALFNPYRAAIWLLTQNQEGWDLARCRRVLANNLPARSKGSLHLLTDDFG